MNLLKNYYKNITAQTGLDSYFQNLFSYAFRNVAEVLERDIREETRQLKQLTPEQQSQAIQILKAQGDFSQILINQFRKIDQKGT